MMMIGGYNSFGAGGYQRSEWDEFKVELAGSMEVFARLEEAAGTMGRHYVHDA